MNTPKIIYLICSTAFIYAVMYSRIAFLLKIIIVVSLVVAMRSVVLD